MSNIEWTDLTINPIHLIREDGSNGGHFCVKVSPECENCYAETINQSNYFAFASHLKYAGKAPKNMIFDEKVMLSVLGMRSSKRIFVWSMTDPWGEWVPDEWLDRAFAIMVLAKQHTFQVLTKRPDRMKNYWLTPDRSQKILDMMLYYTADPANNSGLSVELPIPNIWLGASAGTQRSLDKFTPDLMATPAVVCFLSCEPLLEEITISGQCLDNLNWIIVGGESGPGARPCHIDWIRSLVKQCHQTKTAVFVKQLGGQAIDSNPYIDGIVQSHSRVKLKNRKGGDISEFPLDLQIREFPSWQ